MLRYCLSGLRDREGPSSVFDEDNPETSIGHDRTQLAFQPVA